MGRLAFELLKRCIDLLKFGDWVWRSELVVISDGVSLAPYPGHWGLPAQQRIHCRCTTISVLNI